MQRLLHDIDHYCVVTMSEGNRIAATSNTQTDDDTLKKFYYSLEEHLRKRGVLPPMPVPPEPEEPAVNIMT